MPTITISRQFGSHGDTVAQLLCHRLNYRYFDKNLMTGLAIQAGFSYRDALKLPDEQQQARSLVERLFGNYAPAGGDPGAWAAIAESDRRAQLMAAKITHLIEAAHAQGSVVIVGRGGQAVLHGKPAVLHVRLVAPLELRVQRHMRRAGLDAAQAREQVLQRDLASSDYVQRFYNMNTSDLTLYDIVINTGKVTPSSAADVIIAALSGLPAES